MAILDFIKPEKVIMLDSSNNHGVFEFRPLESNMITFSGLIKSNIAMNLIII